MAAPNLLIIISDEHRRDAMGCMGHGIVKTPHLDQLAQAGTLFTNGYTASPMCVPTRAALACGDHVHNIGHWDSATPYDGSRASWMRQLRDTGRDVTSIGKLHFRSGADDNGFSEEILPMHVVGGVGWAIGLLRENPPPYDVAGELAAQSGRGDTSYSDYDKSITAATIDWLSDPQRQQTPWTAFVSLVSPHYPLMAPAAFYDLYDPAAMPVDQNPLPDHPEIRNMARFFDYESHFDDATKRKAIAAYFGLTSFMDDCVGQICAALAHSGQEQNTNIIYLSDHGEMLGEQGMWTKQVMYDASVGIPLIAKGPDFPAGHVCNTGASILDVAATALDLGDLDLGGLDLDDLDLGGLGASGMKQDKAGEAKGVSLRHLALSDDDPDRTIFSEYHDGGSGTGAFMVRWGDWKYVYYAGMAPQLFHLARDPQELHDRAADTHDPQVTAALHEGKRRLYEICDPEAVNRQAFADQAVRIRQLGGVDSCKTAYLFNHTPTPSEQAALSKDT